MPEQNNVINFGFKYIDGLTVTWLSGSTLQISAGRARNSEDTNDIILEEDTILDASVIGPNGVDFNLISGPGSYYVYLIGSSTKEVPAATLLSPSPFTPYLPLNYDMFSLIAFTGVFVAPNLFQVFYYGKSDDRRYSYDFPLPTFGPPAGVAFLPLVIPAPPISTTYVFQVEYTPTVATNFVEFLPFGSTAANGMVTFGTGVAGVQRGEVRVPANVDPSTGQPTVLIKVTDPGDTLVISVIGFATYKFL